MAGEVMQRELLRAGARLRIYVLRRGERREVLEFLDGLPPSERKKSVALLVRVADHGIPSNPQKYKRLKGYRDLHELKAGQVRLLFFFDRGDLVLAHAFRKRGRGTPAREIQAATWRRDRYLGGQEEADQ